jgi:hypothetical protein
MAIIQWDSRRGRESKHNCDAGGVVVRDHFTFAIVTDAAEGKGVVPASYASDWVKNILNIIAGETDINPRSVIEIMKKAHSSLRRRYINERACYGALLFDHASEIAVAYSCGDCRVGRQIGEEPPEWFSTVHSKVNWNGTPFQQWHAEHPDRHIVTQTLNPRRFEPPEQRGMPFIPGASWVLATDGFWIEHQMLGVGLEELEDDSSLLRITNGADIREIVSDCGNWYQPG